MDQNRALVDGPITNPHTQLATWSARLKRFNVHGEFENRHHNAQNTGIGAIVDDDLSKQLAKPRSLQEK
jgi:hypothetical protein